MFLYSQQLRLTPALYLLQENTIKTGKDKEAVGAKRGRSDSTTGPQRVPLGPGRTATTVTKVDIRIPSARPKLPIANSTSSQLSRPSTSEKLLYATQPQEYEDDLTSEAQESEADDLVSVHEDEDEGEEEEVAETEHDLPSETPETKRARVWPEVSTSRAHRFRQEIDAIREHFDDEVDMYDTTMVSEYAAEIFEYMEDLEVRRHSPRTRRFTDIHPGLCDAEPRLHGRSERDHMGYATDAGRLATAGPPAVPHAPRDPLDRRQHCRQILDEARGIASETSTCRSDRHVHCRKVRRNPGTFGGRVRVHDGEWLYERRDSEGRADNAADARVPHLTLLLAVQLDEEDQQSRRLRSSNTDAEQIPDGSHAA